MSADPVVEIENLHKQFDFVTVLRDVSLDLFAGSIVGLLGSNGAGKSTLIRHVVGLYLPSKGTCTTLGCDAAKLGPRELARIGYVHQEGALVDWMTVAQIVRYVAAYYPSWSTELEKAYLSEFELDLNAIVGDLSPGHRQMLAILLAIGFEPDLLLLDEPAAALDPLARQRFLDLLLSIIQDPSRTILISSHILSDVEKVIDHVVILDRGEIRRDVDLDELQQEFVKLRITAVRGGLPDPLPLPDLLTCERNGSEALVVVRARPEQELERIARRIDSTVDVLPLSLEELYALVLSPRTEEPCR
jgi:ABC-2 type transport system ATP-binding protein